MMQAGGDAFQKCTFLICSLSSCLVHFFSLFPLSQVRPMWWWLCELSTWLVFTFWEPHTCLWLEPTLTSLTLTKGYLQVGPSSYKRWFGLLCARLWEELISSFMPFLIYFRLWAKALLKISLPHLLLLEVTYPLWKILEVICVIPHTHTHTKIKIKHSMKSQRALFSSLFPLQIIFP